MKPIAIHPLSAALALTLALAACSTSQPTSELQLRDQDDYVSGEQTAAIEETMGQRQGQASAPERRERKLEMVAQPVAVGSAIPAAPASEPEPARPAPKLAKQRADDRSSANLSGGQAATVADLQAQTGPADTERYAEIVANPVLATLDQPLSTFSVDVDTGAYSNVRRFLSAGRLPPTDAVRVEELINYFDYDYPLPASLEQPFSVNTELALAPWNGDRWLLQVGLKGFEVPRERLPASNLVFLLDVSGSMNSPDKLPLVQTAMRKLVGQLRPQDRVSIVVYAGAAGLVLPPTGGDEQATILAALDALQAGGSTNGGQGIELAYRVAREAFIEGGVNRVILATDGDFNVGTVDQGALEDLVSRQRSSGVALTTLGFGRGNYNDHLAERLANLGDGNHAYIDTELEAHKVLVDELGANLLTIAKDVKIQIEFNPAVVAEYRLIGYENRLLANEDFNNDQVDAGEIGAGHTVTALYELTPVNSPARRLPELVFGDKPAVGGNSRDVAFLKLRYKQPTESRSRLIEQIVAQPAQLGSGSARLRFAAAVAAYGEALRGGKYLDGYRLSDVAQLASAASGQDAFGLQREFLQLVQRASQLRDGEPAQLAKISD
ncbi:MAG: VWA domain-containing protein [Xanthomonadales bacterium]|nr:VWA domain-containing protein [Xanthomonadales bacterium]